METHLYTLLSRGRAHDLRAIGDGPCAWGVLGPLWALGCGLWLTALAMLGLLAAAGVWDPRLVGPVWAALAALSVMEGAAIERLERRLWGWREVGLVEARSPEGAEELHLTRPAPPPAAPADPTPPIALTAAAALPATGAAPADPTPTPAGAAPAPADPTPALALTAAALPLVGAMPETDAATPEPAAPAGDGAPSGGASGSET